MRPTSALLMDLITGHSSLIEISSDGCILERFSGDVRGKTLERLGDVYVRAWTECVPEHSRTLAMVDAYRADTFERVDLPEELRERCWIRDERRSHSIKI
jgi:hypothetical protein